MSQGAINVWRWKNGQCEMGSAAPAFQFFPEDVDNKVYMIGTVEEIYRPGNVK